MGEIPPEQEGLLQFLVWPRVEGALFVHLDGSCLFEIPVHSSVQKMLGGRGFGFWGIRGSFLSKRCCHKASRWGFLEAVIK